MKNRDSALRRYLRTVRSYLPCSRKVKKRILEEIQGNVNAYLEENPKADYAQIEVRFGSPQSIAAAYVDDMDTQELLLVLHVKKKVTRIIATAMLIAVLMWTVGVTYIMIKDANNYPGIINEEVGVIEHIVNDPDSTISHTGE